MCCGVGGNSYEEIIEMLQAIYQGQLQCTICGELCADTEPNCPVCGGVLESPLRDLLDTPQKQGQQDIRVRWLLVRLDLLATVSCIIRVKHNLTLRTES
jgi:hypothetical protein